ncbi:MAG: hypothetical protein OXC37_04100 [Bdellovibrionaceae bacterium]|nr:hypothetical protein [Pseudobdellovibrionaceae bacterium]
MRFLFLIFYTSLSLAQTLILSPGDKVNIPLPIDQTIRLGDKSLLILQKENQQISLIAKKEGHTLLRTQNKLYKIFIFNKENKIKALYLDKSLKKLWGLNWTLSKDNIFEVKGQLYRFSDWLEIRKECSKYNIPYYFKAQMDEEIKKISSYYFKTVLKQDIEMIRSNLPYVFVPMKSLLSNYKNLKEFGLIPKEKELWFLKSPFIQIDLAVVETLSSAILSTGGNLTKTLFQFSSILDFLNFLKSSGKGKTLHHSSVTTQSGQKIEINSGGQIPFPSYNLKTDQKIINWKSHGLQIHLTPTLGKKDQIKLNIKTQLSEPLPFSSSNQAPPLKTHNLESELILDNNQIIKIFQLNKQLKGRQYKTQFGFLELIPSILSGGQNNYKMTKSVFIQTKLLKEEAKPNQLKEIL